MDQNIFPLTLQLQLSKKGTYLQAKSLGPLNIYSAYFFFPVVHLFVPLQPSK